MTSALATWTPALPDVALHTKWSRLVAAARLVELTVLGLRRHSTVHTV
jgi:hypothetical protein